MLNSDLSYEKYEEIKDEMRENKENVELYYVYVDNIEWPLMMVVKNDYKNYELEEKKEYNILLKYFEGDFYIESTYEIK